MSKVISPVYASGAMYSLREKWSPDPSIKKKRRIKMHAAAPPKAGVELTEAQRKNKEDRALWKKKMRLAGLLRQRAHVGHLLRKRFDAKSDAFRIVLDGTIADLKSEISDLSASTSLALAVPNIIDVPATVALSVPVPADRATQSVCMPSREGQARFRAMVIAAYGKCAVTGCQDEVALQAAHIIPYVDERSHVIRNGICLRSDIHCLFDRGLVEIGADCTITVDDSVRSADYRALHGRVAIMPDRVDDRPCAVLLSERSKHL